MRHRWKKPRQSMRCQFPGSLRDEEEVAVRVAMLIVVLRETETPVPDALAAVPMGVTMTGTEVVLLRGC
jgi:hypothetical protein